MRAPAGILTTLVLAAVFAALAHYSTGTIARGWTPAEQRLIDSLQLTHLAELPVDPTNAVAASERAALLGHRLFFDPRTSVNGLVACATCHQPERAFTDGLPVAIGTSIGARNTMSLIGAAHSPWLFWDGRADSLWSQALGPLENPPEHAGVRAGLAHLIARDGIYRASYERLFGPLPDLDDPSRFPGNASPLGDQAAQAQWDAMHPDDQAIIDRVFTNLGKALAAYQRLLQPGPSRFDAYGDALAAGDPTGAGALDAHEIEGLRLFIGKAQCIHCHNGPLFTNHEFHNTGVLPRPGSVPDMGRAAVVDALLASPFNCTGIFSDAPDTCAELEHMRRGDELVGAHRAPGLRNVTLTAPYMHAGQIPTLAGVLRHYNAARDALIGHNEAKPLGLGSAQLRRLEAFLGTLTAPPATEPRWLAPPPDLPTAGSPATAAAP